MEADYDLCYNCKELYPRTRRVPSYVRYFPHLAQPQICPKCKAEYDSQLNLKAVKKTTGKKKKPNQ